MDEWKTVSEFFDAINNSTQYVILRNHESLPDYLVQDNHPDIDILCTDRNLFCKVSKSVSRAKRKKDKIHREVIIAGNKVKLDVRSIGDGYYDINWERCMIEKRIYSSKGFYILDNENYYYSLIYHSLIHKKKVSDDYRYKIEKMCNDFGYPQTTDILSALETYMLKKGYCYSYPQTNSTCFNVEGVSSSLIEKNLIKKAHRKIWQLLIMRR